MTCPLLHGEAEYCKVLLELPKSRSFRNEWALPTVCAARVSNAADTCSALIARGEIIFDAGLHVRAGLGERVRLLALLQLFFHSKMQ
jgi:hypothetical protein